MDEINGLRADMDKGANPRDIKIKLAEELVERFHGAEAAATAHRSAGNRLKEGELPDDIPEVAVETDVPLPVSAVLNRAGLVKNAAAAKDLLSAGSVRVDGAVVDREFMFQPGVEYVCQAGKKKFARITLKSA